MLRYSQHLTFELEIRPRPNCFFLSNDVDAAPRKREVDNYKADDEVDGESINMAGNKVNDAEENNEAAVNNNAERSPVPRIMTLPRVV